MPAKLTWTAASKTGTTVSGYRPREAGVVLATLAADARSYTDPSATNGTEYDVIADFADGTSVTSAAVAYTTGVPAGRGPDGTHWPPNTPAYTTAATVTGVTLAGLAAAINAASSGDVIEMAAGTYTTETFVTAGSSAWAQNVLVRPPLGQRGGVHFTSLYLTGTKVTLAGITGGGLRMDPGSADCYFARCYDKYDATVPSDNGAYILIQGTRVGCYEVVCRNLRHTWDIGRGLGPGSAQVLEGCFFQGSAIPFPTPPPDQEPHADAWQSIEGTAVSDVTVRDSIFIGGDNAGLTFNTGSVTTLKLFNTGCYGNKEPLPAEWQIRCPYGFYGGPAEMDGCDIGRGFYWNTNNNGTITNSTIPEIFYPADKTGRATIGAGTTVVAGYNPTTPMARPTNADLDAIWDL